jgi:hypothetical protein
MNRKLRITVELSWRGGCLDLVSNVAEYELLPRSEYPWQFGPPKYEKQGIELSNGELVFVWISFSEERKFCFSLEYKGGKIISLDTDDQFYLEIYLPDQKQYQFKVISDES